MISHESVPSPCALCSALHSPAWRESQTITGLQTWFNKLAGCRSWDGQYPRLRSKHRDNRARKV